MSEKLTRVVKERKEQLLVPEKVKSSSDCAGFSKLAMAILPRSHSGCSYFHKREK